MIVKSAWFLVFCVLLIGSVRGQSTLTVKGKITDSAGNVLAGAHLDLFSVKDPPAAFSAVSGSNGSFEIKKITADTFRVLISMPGYPLITKRWILADTSADLGTI